MKPILGVLTLAMFATIAQSQPVTVFRGRPSVKISEGGIERLPEAISREKAINVECVISRIGDELYWASRENVPMVAVDSGAFIVYIAATGAGYVKVIRPNMKEIASLMGETEAKFDYVEHITLGLRSVTYYGKVRP
jgi:hypothetical protein